MELKQIWIICALALSLLSCSRGNPCSLDSQTDQCNLIQQLADIAQEGNELADAVQERAQEEAQKMVYTIDNDVTEEIDIYFRNRRSADKPMNDSDEIINNSISENDDGSFRESDVLDLTDLEIILSRANKSKVVVFRGIPHLKINGSFVETNEGSTKLLTFIYRAKHYAGGSGFNTTSPDIYEGLGTHQLGTVRSKQGIKRENRFEVSYWRYKFEPGSGSQELLEKYEVKVRCQANPPGHTLTVNQYNIVSGTSVWRLAINEACRFWRA